jgi:hypothetical protein
MSQERQFSKAKFAKVRAVLAEHDIVIRTNEKEREALFQQSHIAEFEKQLSISKPLNTDEPWCELCGLNAPFNDLRGKPYLLGVRISQSVKDAESDENIASLCPNCAARIYVLRDADDVSKLQYLKAQQHKE